MNMTRRKFSIITAGIAGAVSNAGRTTIRRPERPARITLTESAAPRVGAWRPVQAFKEPTIRCSPVWRPERNDRRVLEQRPEGRCHENSDLAACNLEVPVWLRPRWRLATSGMLRL